jgi:CYTH domain-containing protein
VKTTPQAQGEQIMTRTYTTADGSTVEVTRRGYTVDMHLRNAAGHTVATVEMNDDDANALIDDLMSV